MDLSTLFTINKKISEFAQNYLMQKGWYWSLDGMPRNQEGYVPWITYPAYMQLTRIVKPKHKVFEFGCGASSLWWATRAAEVVGVDHDKAWIEKIMKEKPGNLTLITKEIDAPCDPDHLNILKPFFDIKDDFPMLDSPDHNIQHGLVNDRFTAYAAEIIKYPKGYFDIICIDGMARALTSWIAADYLKEDGIIVFDNSDRWQYAPAYNILWKKGFRRTDFYGPGPVNIREWCTSIFAKNLNFLNDNIHPPKVKTI